MKPSRLGRTPFGTTRRAAFGQPAPAPSAQPVPPAPGPTAPAPAPDGARATPARGTITARATTGGEPAPDPKPQGRMVNRAEKHFWWPGREATVSALVLFVLSLVAFLPGVMPGLLEAPLAAPVLSGVTKLFGGPALMKKIVGAVLVIHAFEAVAAVAACLKGRLPGSATAAWAAATFTGGMYGLQGAQEAAKRNTARLAKSSSA
ncbi:unnamed protein product [Pedinophyceae sp. YPF-701]|nr:unnamed protein product [Pedinophyceae sp. YPF-701]